MASRRIAGELPYINEYLENLRSYQVESVSRISAGLSKEGSKTSSWIVLYGEGLTSPLSCWSSSGVLDSMKRNVFDSTVTALEVSKESGKIAVGSEEGRIYIYSPDLRDLIWEGRVHEKEVVRMIFLTYDTFISAGKDGSVRRIRL
jgi:WD40 repeat protein